MHSWRACAGGAAAWLLDLLFTLISPNIAGRLCVFVPKSKWYSTSSSIKSRCGFLTRTSPFLQGDSEEMGEGTRQCPQAGGQAEVGHRAAWKLHGGTHSPGVRRGMGQGQGTSQLCVVLGPAVFLPQVTSLICLLLYIYIFGKNISVFINFVNGNLSSFLHRVLPAMSRGDILCYFLCDSLLSS